MLQLHSLATSKAGHVAAIEQVSSPVCACLIFKL
uniref:Uncharacterized protein n=1 Tax=Arundo donax TaxID=35708 RepID=A0A0A8YCL3_ARUDO